MPSQTAAEQGVAKLCILDFKTTWSEFQKTSQTATQQGKAKLRLLNLKPHGQNSKSAVRLLSCKAKLSYIHSLNHIFSLFHLLKVWPKHLCAFAPLGCTLEASTSYLHNYFNLHVCPSLQRCSLAPRPIPL